MNIHITGAKENNLKDIQVRFSEGLTVVTGVSGSGKSSLVFDTLHHEAQRRFQEMFTLGASQERLPPAAVDSITGLVPAVAVGQNLLNRNPASTVATACGLHPLLRLLFARFGDRRCPSCGNSFTVFDEDSLIEKIRTAGRPCQVRVPLVQDVSGSHATLLGLLEKAFGRSMLHVDGASWTGNALAPETPHQIAVSLASLRGEESPTALRDLLERAAALGASALALHTPEGMQTLSFSPVCPRCGTWQLPLEPTHFNRSCPDCDGDGCVICQDTGMLPRAAATRWQGLRLDQFLAQPTARLQGDFNETSLPASAARLASEIRTRLDALVRMGLGYLSLDRSAPTLSRGEAQRLRLAVLLTGRLSDLLHLLDEPTIGQHPQDVENLMTALTELTGPVIFVEHDPIAAGRAGRAVDIGPGAGGAGGRVVFSGPSAGLWAADTVSGRFFSGRESAALPEKRPVPTDFLTVKGATRHNLSNLTVALALERLNVVCGVSGSGKSTLVENILFASLHEKAPQGCTALTGAPRKAVMVDQAPIGHNPRSNPATYTKLMNIIRDCFAANTGLDATCFSFNTREGACPRCKGMGAVEVKMRYLPSAWIPCGECEGQRYADEVLDARVAFSPERHLNIAEVLDRTVEEALPLLDEAPGLTDRARSDALRLLRALEDIGLGYLTLGQPSPSLSGGEAQRVKLAKFLGKRRLKDSLLILDEPSTGLHPADIHGLLMVLDRLVRSGATIVVVEHNTDIIRAADWLVELGPGAGPQGGRLLFSGPPEDLGTDKETPTSRALAVEAHRPVQPPAPKPETENPENISIRGARANNLKDVDLNLPKGSLTVVTGLSGSGKSSLVSDVIEREARRRYLESLAMYERQGLREGREADVDSLKGLGVTFSIGTERASYNQRAHLGDDTEIIPGLAVLFSRGGVLPCPDCGQTMAQSADSLACPDCGRRLPRPKPRHFSPATYAAACQTCNGVGNLQEPRPEKLITAPEKPLCDGAMHSPGFFPKGYLCKPFNGGYDMVQALAARYGFDPASTPWNEMIPEAQKAFLFGDPKPMTVTYTSRSGRVRTQEQIFPGFYGWIRDWDVGGTYTETVSCPECRGAGLRQPYRSVKLQGKTIVELRRIPLSDLHAIVRALPPSLAEDPFAGPMLEKVRQRLNFLCRVGLEYLHLDRYSATLSAGEAQRVRLAGLLGGRLTGLTLLLDEPTRGLHPTEVDALANALQQLRQEGNTVLVVEHDLQIIRAADVVVDMGPGAGRAGGRIVAQGPPDAVARTETYTGRWLRGEVRAALPEARRKPRSWLRLYQPAAHNVKLDVLEIPLGMLVGVCGPSGSGKSTLIHDTLGRILAPARQTTSVAYEPVEPGPYARLEGAPSRTLIVDQTRAGLHNPASFLGVKKALHKRFAESEMAAAMGLDHKTLGKGCTACKGRGAQRIKMGFLPDIFETCAVCGGTGYPPEAASVRLRGLTLPETMGLPIRAVREAFSGMEKITRRLKPAEAVGLGYLILNQPARTLSGGEAQRLKIAHELGKRTRPDTLYLLDEPTVGQHLEDVQRLVTVLQTLVQSGQSVLVVEHHPHLLAACDWLVELGPGGGPDGGRLIAAGTPEELSRGQTPTAPYLQKILEDQP
jgi:excinuclease ABC subunit A